MSDHERDTRVRPATTADTAPIHALQRHLREPSPELLSCELTAGSVLVSDAAGEVAGYALPVAAATRRGCHLAELVVAPRFRRAGRARGLVEAVIADADGPVTLQAHPANDAALALYADCGFDVIDRRPGAYADGDALVLRRR